MNLTFDSMPPVLNATQLSEVLGISRAGAYNLMHREDFRTLQMGKRLLVPRESLMIWIKQKTGGGAA